MVKKKESLRFVFSFVLFLISYFSLSFGISSSEIPQNDVYYNSSTGIEVFGIPSIIYGGTDELTNNAIITQVSSIAQQNKYICFRATCNNFNIRDSNNNAPNLIPYNNIAGLYCVDTKNIVSTGIIYLYCGVNLKDKLDYVLSENNYYDILFESSDIIKKYSGLSGGYADSVYYTSKSPGENMLLKLYVIDINTQHPIYLSSLENPMSILYMRETYSLHFISSEISENLCEDRTCFLFDIAIPRTGTPKKSLLISPLIVMGELPQGVSLAEYCRGDTSNNCISKSVLFYPKVYSGDLIIEGIKDLDGRYYYGQNLTIKMENYDEYDIGDSGTIEERYFQIVDRDNGQILSTIPYNPQNDDEMVYAIDKSFSGKSIGIVYVVKYRNGYGDIIEYNTSREIEISDEFAYNVKLNYTITSVREYVEHIHPEAYLAGSDILAFFVPYLEDKHGNVVYDNSLTVEILNIGDNNCNIDDLSIEKITSENYMIDNNGRITGYLIRLPPNITCSLTTPMLNLEIDGNVNGEIIHKRISIPLDFMIIPSYTYISSTEFFKGEGAEVISLFSQPITGSLEDAKIYTSLKDKESVEVSYTSHNDMYSINTTFEIPSNYIFEYGFNCLSFEYTINDYLAVFEKCIEILERLSGMHLTAYISDRGFKRKLRKNEIIDIEFDNIYDIQKINLYLKNIGDQNLNMDYFKVLINNNPAMINIKPVLDKDNNENMFSSGEEYMLTLYLFGANLNSSNKVTIGYGDKTLINFTIRKKIISANRDISLSLDDRVILYDKNKGIGSGTLNMLTNVDNMGTIGLKIRISSEMCSPHTIYENKELYVISEPGNYRIPIEIRNDILGKCGKNVTLTFILLRTKYDVSFVILTYETLASIKKVEESPLQDKLMELDEILDEIEYLCDILNNKSCENLDISEICEVWLPSAKQKRRTIDLIDIESRETLNELYANATTYRGELKRCNYTQYYLSTYEELKERFESLYNEICVNEENVKKIRSHLSGQDVLDYENICNFYEEYLSIASVGDLDVYKQGIDELQYYKEFLSMPERKPPYGKYLAIFLFLVILMVIVVYVVIKYSSSKPKIEMDEDLYSI